MWKNLVILAVVTVCHGDYSFHKLELRGPKVKLETPGYPSVSSGPVDNEYSLRTTELDHKVNIHCDTIELKGDCKSNYVEINDGDTPQKLCGGLKNFDLQSNGGKVVVKIKADGGSRVSCTAEAAPNPLDAFLIFQDEELDSKEAGIKPASKSTTCPCGSANPIVHNITKETEDKNISVETFDSVESSNSLKQKRSVLDVEWVVPVHSRTLSSAPSRIVGGKETKANQYPFIVGIANVDTMFLFCGASIISKRHALTAAHCTYTRTDKRKLAIVAGFHDIVEASVKRGRKGEVIKISNIIEHEGYNPKTMLDDIALLVLAEDVKYSTNIQPVCMPTGHVDIVGQFIRVLGWGKVGTGLAMSDVLRTVALKVLPIEVCADKFANVPTTNPTQVCTFGHGKDSCQGDSGGPLVWLDPETNRYTLVALVSYGKKECAGEHPGLNTEVAAYLTWINKHIKESSAGAFTCSKA